MTKPTEAAMRAARAILYGSYDGEHVDAAKIAEVARIIDEETGLAELREALTMITSTITIGEAHFVARAALARMKGSGE